MNFCEILFFASCFIIFYNYIGYALIALVINFFLKKTTPNIKNCEDVFFPSVSFIVAAYNEEDFINEKINNCLSQNYPLSNIEYIFVADGSSDKTCEIIAANSGVKLMFEHERKGKSAAMNRAAAASENDILIFSDANTVLNADAVNNIVRHYQNQKVGGVGGEKKVMSLQNSDNDVGEGEGLYWKYESFLKKTDSDFYSVVGAAGELFSLRKILYEPVDSSVILDDFVITLKIAEKGYRVIYEPSACATELPSFSIQEEKKRKIRIAAGGFQAMVILKGLLAFWKNPRLSFLYISHRVLRWTLSPVCLALALFSNICLAIGDRGILFKFFLIIQIMFYLMAFIASLSSSKKGVFKIFNVCYYFTFMNISVFQGFLRFLKGNQKSTWEKAKRAEKFS